MGQFWAKGARHPSIFNVYSLYEAYFGKIGKKVSSLLLITLHLSIEIHCEGPGFCCQIFFCSNEERPASRAFSFTSP